MDVFAAIADPVRRDILVRLTRGPARVSDLAEGRSISRPAVSKHLRGLTDAGLVVGEVRGRERHYRLVRAALEPVSELLHALSPEPPFSERDLDGLDLEVRRAGRDRRTAEHEPRRTNRTEEETA